MKVAPIMRFLTFLAVLVGVIALSGFSSRAQTEIDPDHSDSPNTQLFEKAKPNASSEAVTIHYEGKFSLPYTVQYSGKGLRPGKYSVSLLSDRKVGQAILNRRGRAIPIPGVVPKQANKHQTDAILAQVDGRTRRLSAIHISELDWVLDPATQLESSSHCKPKRFERLPPTVTARKK